MRNPFVPRLSVALSYDSQMPFPPDKVEIGQVAVDSAGRLLVRPLLPAGTDFAHIYRAAMEISWDATSNHLVAPVPEKWSQADWFKQFVRAVHEEYGTRLLLCPATHWEHVSSEDRAEIERWSRDTGH